MGYGNVDACNISITNRQHHICFQILRIPEDFQTQASPYTEVSERRVQMWDVVKSCPQTQACRQGWRTVRALGCWLSHLSWLSQQDVTAAPLSVARWPLDLASSPLTCPITASTVSLCSPHSHLNVFAASMRISALVSKRRHKLTISDCGLTSVGSGCWLQFVGFW